jgi:DNA-directed RNA polymerase alpha subunit
MARSRTEAAEKTFGQADHLQNGVGFHGIPIEELDLSILSYNALKRSGINTIEELKEWDEDRLLSVRNTGKKIVAEVTEKIAEWEKRRATDG